MMGIELKNVRLLTQEQHDAEVLKDQTEHYRQVALGQEQDILRLQRKIKKMRKERKALVSDIEGYVQVANEYAVENDSLVRQLSDATLERNKFRSQLSEAQDNLREYQEEEELEDEKYEERAREFVRAIIETSLVHAVGQIYGPMGEPQAETGFATGGVVNANSRPAGDVAAILSPPQEYIIPHHGPGLCAAEDAMKDDGRYEFVAAFGAAVDDMAARLDEEIPEPEKVTVRYRGEQVRMSALEAVKLQEINDLSAPFMNAGRAPIVQAGDLDSVHYNNEEYKAHVEHVASALKDLPADDINHPSHYQGDNGIECIDAIQAALTAEEFRGYCKGNIQKYVWRERQKQGDDSIRKARWYLNRMLGDE